MHSTWFGNWCSFGVPFRAQAIIANAAAYGQWLESEKYCIVFLSILYFDYDSFICLCLISNSSCSMWYANRITCFACMTFNGCVISLELRLPPFGVCLLNVCYLDDRAEQYSWHFHINIIYCCSHYFYQIYLTDRPWCLSHSWLLGK